MKKLLLLLLVSTTSMVSAQYLTSTHKDADGKQYALSYIKGTKVNGNYLKNEAPTLYYKVWIEGSTYYYDIMIHGVNYKYDNSGQDLNWIKVKTIVNGNKSSLTEFQGKISNDEGTIKIINKDWAPIKHFLDNCINNNYIHIRLGNDNENDATFRFNLNGFTAGRAKAKRLILAKHKGTNNPFENNVNNNKNPFQG